jgi:hypothetical protein
MHLVDAKMDTCKRRFALRGLALQYLIRINTETRDCFEENLQTSDHAQCKKCYEYISKFRLLALLSLAAIVDKHKSSKTRPRKQWASKWGTGKPMEHFIASKGKDRAFKVKLQTSRTLTKLETEIMYEALLPELHL